MLGLRYLALLGFAFTALANAKPVLIGKSLLNGQGVTVEPGKKGSVVVFMSAKCPCSDSHTVLVKDLSEQFKDFNFVVVHSNTDEAIDSSKDYFANAHFSFPVIQDEDGKLADQFRALKTPHAFLMDKDGKILYKGGVTSSKKGPEADTHYLKEALTDVNEGKNVRVAEGRTLGCIIKRGQKNVW